MEDQLVQLLANTQLSAEGPRKQAELNLRHLRADPAYPISLANIASHTAIALNIRQSALASLRQFIQANWSLDGDDDEVEVQAPINIPDTTKTQIRSVLLELVLSNEDERKIKAASSYAVGKIAVVDFPEQWPQLLPTLLQTIPAGSDTQLYGALKVLQDLVEESLSEEQFFSMARDIIKVVYDCALNENRKPSLRALAVSVFRGCFDLMDIVKEDHKQEVKAFADEALQGWLPFFEHVLKGQLPQRPAGSAAQPEEWNGPIALKLQVVKALTKIKSVFPALLLPQSHSFFRATWEELSLLQAPYQELYVESGAQGRLEDADSLPYTLDFLVLEEIDFFNQLIRAPPVQKELNAEIKNRNDPENTTWLVDLMKLLVSYAQITQEEEALWDIDVSLYLSEETSVTSNYTARTASGDLLIKVGEWLGLLAMGGLFTYTKTLFTEGNASWRILEASLYLFHSLLGDFQDLGKTVSDDILEAYLGVVDGFMNQKDSPLLQARGYLVAGTLSQSYTKATGLLDRAIQAINNEESELVQVACIKAVESFIKSEKVPLDRQIPILNALQQFLEGKDLTELDDADDLLVTMLEALRAAVGMEKRIAISPDIKAIDILFMIARHGASNFQVTVVVNETFEEIVRSLRDSASYATLCAKVLPSLTGAFDVGNVTEDDPLITLVTELLAVLVQYGPEPLPAGFVASTLPKLTRLLMSSSEGEVLRPGAEAVKDMLMHDHQQVFSWHDETGRSGLEVCLLIIDRLLGPAIEDNAASEVGGLAAELVEKAGSERLGPFLPQLLQAVAGRLATAQAAPFIQSLILVFARLSLNSAHDVVEFLSTIQIGSENGLQVVMSKWLENSVSFAGYDEIRQK
jgi:importin-9